MALQATAAAQIKEGLQGGECPELEPELLAADKAIPGAPC